MAGDEPPGEILLRVLGMDIDVTRNLGDSP
jgi:hypothetical protein